MQDIVFGKKLSFTILSVKLRYRLQEKIFNYDTCGEVNGIEIQENPSISIPLLTIRQLQQHIADHPKPHSPYNKKLPQKHSLLRQPDLSISISNNPHSVKVTPLISTLLMPPTLRTIPNP